MVYWLFDIFAPMGCSRVRGLIETITNGQSPKHYQHVLVPIIFTKQTGNIAGNHNLTKTY